MSYNRSNSFFKTMMIDGIELKESIGKGAFGLVHRGVTKDGKCYALKKVSKALLLSETKKTYFNNEVYLLKQVNHENIVKYFSIKETISNYYLVIEYCNGGTLLNALSLQLNLHNSAFPEDIVRFIIKQILQGLAYLHNNHIIHRDLKAENILLSFDNETDKMNSDIKKAKIKIIDFGFARYLEQNELASSIIGTPLCMDPNMLNMGCSRNNKQCYYTGKCDIWSLGIMTYYLLIGTLPFQGNNWDELYQKVKNSSFTIPSDRKLSKESILFISKLLNVEESRRPSANELLTDPFVLGNYDKSTVFTLKEDNGNEMKKCFSDYWKETVSLSKNNHRLNKSVASFFGPKNKMPFDSKENQISRQIKIDNLMKRIKHNRSLSVESNQCSLIVNSINCGTPVKKENQYPKGGLKAFFLAQNLVKKVN